MAVTLPADRAARLLARGRVIAPGAAVALTIAAAASFVSLTYGGPIMLLALLLGMALNFLLDDATCRDGIAFASKTVLRVGVALLGLRIAAADVASLGLATIELVALGVVVTILSGVGMARLVGRGRRFGTLIGGATAICGASAALALSSVLPHRPDGDRETIFTVVAVTTLSTIAMVAYPVLFRALGFDDYEIGILIGATIHDVAQVVGAGYAVSDVSGDTATVVKLFRVALLLPTVLVVSFVFARARTGTEKRSLPVPVFAIAFAVLVAANSLGLVPELLREPLVAASRWCLVVAVAAIGLSTSLKEIAKVGYPPVFVAVGSTLTLLAFSLAAVVLKG